MPASPHPEPRADVDGRLIAGMIAAVLAISTAAPAIRLAEPLGSEAVACVRVTITGLGLMLFAWPSARAATKALAAAPRERRLTVLAGLCLAAHFATWIASLSLTSVVRSVALVSTQPLWAGLIARAMGERVPTRLYLGSLVALAGTVVMVAEPGAGLGESGALAWLGDGLALIGAVTAAIYLALGRRVHGGLGDALPVEGYFVLVNVVAGVSLWTFALARGAAFNPEGIGVADWSAVVWLGLVPGLVGHGLLNWAVRRVPVHTVALATLLEPVGAAIIAWLLLGEGVATREAVGGLILLGGVGLGLPRAAREDAGGHSEEDG